MSQLSTIEADSIQMRQLFQNLIGNALKFQKESGKPLIEARDTSLGDGITEIYVADNGIGFDAEYLDRIFVPFHPRRGSVFTVTLPTKQRILNINRLIIVQTPSFWRKPESSVFLDAGSGSGMTKGRYYYETVNKSRQE